MRTKTCFRCSAEKPIDDFYRHPGMADGHLGKCKDCAKADVRKHRRESDTPREYDRRRYAEDPERRASVAAIGKRRAAFKTNANTKLKRAVASGKIKKPDECSRCGVTGVRIVGHHEDYSKPLDVIWFCDKCHARHHWAKP